MVKGIIGKISKKDYQGKTLTSFALKGQDGWYSLGERSLQYNEGDSIQFNVQTRGRYEYAQDITPWVDGGAASAPQVPSGSNGSGRSFQGRKPFTGGKSQEEKDYWAKRDEQQEVTQRRIEIQAARNAAIETATVMFEKELVKVPTKQADKYDAFLELVEVLTDDFLKKTAQRLGIRGDTTERSSSTEQEGTPEDSEEDTKGVW